ncbi:branched-chain amino acid ABC transporter permease [Rhodoferax antarcticus]|uniref:ABC transporter permease, branched-chain amino acid transport system n=1 Tax=Rhodoferax antarcticus ANT.BR TaxID=1111071 RepID=A0A1Q8YEQ9_9BURK|nr:branched-chain amino acid ABC transporter permease [Rhodoferax antarcticus]APW46296.1 branched-chain amino acid ABC transporter permease [Rhodoferax antarcticus]OLP06506.1 ABC transporter permease, branched-chain amino acid transport system [Rhodoferax antarcticus ANT.BR]
MAFFTLSLLNGISYGLLLFLLSSGLTLIWGMMGVLNFAHASFYMVGAYLAYTLSGWLGFWPALLLAPLGVGLLGAAFERLGLRLVRRFGHMSELLITFGLSYILVELVQLIWGRSSVDYRVPPALDGPLFTLFDNQFPMYRAFIMAVTLLVLAALAWLVRTRAGLVIRAALTQPDMAQALGHNVPRVFTVVFGVGCALAGLAGVLGGNAFVTEPGMAQALGGVVFVVVVVGGLGSLKGAFVASMAIGLLQTFVVALDVALLPALPLKISQLAPVLPYAVMVLMLILRPQGLMGSAQRHGAY